MWVENLKAQTPKSKPSELWANPFLQWLEFSAVTSESGGEMKEEKKLHEEISYIS